MQDVFDFLFAQYADYPKQQVLLEIIAVVFGIISVYFSSKNNVLVYPTGLVSTIIFIYLLYKWGLFGDLLVNFYYTLMSIFGWYIWSQKDTEQGPATPITSINQVDRKSIGLIFVGSIFIVSVIYILFDKLKVDKHAWIPYTDIFTTAIFFVGMWLMAKRKIEHWYFWIVANMISIPLYFIKGYTFTSFQYVIFLVLAFWGIVEWRRLYREQNKLT